MPGKTAIHVAIGIACALWVCICLMCTNMPLGSPRGGYVALAQEQSITRDDELAIQVIKSRGIFPTWEAACMQLASNAADEGDYDRSLRLLRTLVERPRIDPALLYRALWTRARLATTAKRYDEAEQALDELRVRFKETKTPFSEDGLPPQLAAEIDWWGGTTRLLAAQGKIADALQSLHDAGPAIRRAMRDSGIGKGYQKDIEVSLQIGLREDKCGLYEKVGNYRMALSTLRDAVDYGKDARVWDFKRAREGQMRQNWEKRSAELLTRYEAGAAAQDYLQSWRDKKHDAMYALLSDAQRGHVSKTDFGSKLNDLEAAGTSLLRFEELIIAEVTSKDARATVKLAFSKDSVPDASSGQNEVLLIKTDEGWFIESIRKVQTQQP